MKNLKKIKGDASFREFFRKQNKLHSSIIVLAKKEKFKNLVVYDAINKILIKNKVLAPKLYYKNYRKNYIEIEDFGNKTFHNELNKKRKNQFSYFKKIIGLLIKIQSIKNRKIKTFNNKSYLVPKYDNRILINETNLFCDWYVKKNLSKTNVIKFSKEFKKIIKKLCKNLKLKNNIFVHRDFHVSNLMLVNKKIGIIDSQDSLIGNAAYDLAPLIDDVRLKTSKSLKNKTFDFYLKKQKKMNVIKFKNDFEILSVLRNLKIIGIFTRLAIRYRKKNYLKLSPHAWELINIRINENNTFYDLRKLLIKYFRRKII